jgi:asparagine synthase (glutamine-hydrolysing)
VDYLQYSCIPAPRTIFKGICKLEPGQMWEGNHPELRQAYWDLHYDEDNVDLRPEEAWASELYSAIETAVRHSMGLLVPYNSMGCFLSGGTDSSSVAGLAGRVSGAPPHTFSIGFDDPRYNEIGYARIAAESFGADHHEYFVKPDDISQLIHKAAHSYDEPFGNSSIIPTYYCARLAAANGMTYLLAGDGGDELFGGNERYVKDPVFQRYSNLPQWLRQGLIEPSIQLGNSLMHLSLLEKAGRYVKRANIPLPDRLYSYSFFSEADPASLFHPSFQTEANGHHPLNAVRRYYEAAPSRNYLNRWLYLDVKITIGANDLRKVTRMCQLAGIKARYPLLDPDLAEFSGKIPALLKVKGNQLRYLFKKAMASVLPQAVINKTKHGFGLPFSVWLGEHQQLRELTLDTLGSSRCRQRGYFQSNLLERLWQLYLADHRIFYGDVLWVLLMLEMWHLQQEEAYSSR